MTREMEAASLIGIWLKIHDGKPPETPEEVASVASEIITTLAAFAFGDPNQASVDTIKLRIGELNGFSEESVVLGSPDARARGGVDFWQ